MHYRFGRKPKSERKNDSEWSLHMDKCCQVHSAIFRERMDAGTDIFGGYFQNIYSVLDEDRPFFGKKKKRNFKSYVIFSTFCFGGNDGKIKRSGLGGRGLTPTLFTWNVIIIIIRCAQLFAFNYSDIFSSIVIVTCIHNLNVSERVQSRFLWSNKEQFSKKVNLCG